LRDWSVTLPRIAAFLLGLCLLASLSACNRVYSAAPVFTEADATGAPVLREGLWLIEGGTVLLTAVEAPARCRLDTSKPAQRWPKTCATAVVIRDGRLLQYFPEPKGPGGWAVQPFLLTGGEPSIFQMSSPEIPGAPEEPADPAAPAAPPRLSYMTLKPTALDAAGKVVAFDIWPVLCGPYPPRKKKLKKDETQRYLTLELNPGLTEDGNDCLTDSKDALRAAAKLSPGWEGEALHIRWVRETYP